jgi:cation diffusion facilitator CzcD-associated flavoprotein CzcO
MSVEQLEQCIAQEIEYLKYPQRPWVPEHHHLGQRVLDVLIVGGGQTGMSLAFALQLERIDNVEVVEAKAAGHEGPWIDFARMLTLRSPKYVTGPDAGVPSLTPRAWFEARFGAAAWRGISKIGRETWQEYLTWYRRVTGLVVQNGMRVSAIAPEGDYLAVRLEGEAGGETRYTRRVVLATGLDFGSAQIPDVISANLPRERYAHTTEPIDFTQLRGKRVGVLGAGASAFDNAGTALDYGATSVDLCARREDLPRTNVYRWMENVGFLGQFAELDDAMRWRMARRILQLNQPPPQETMWRCRRFPNFGFHSGSPWLSVELRGDGVAVATPKRAFSFDFVIVGTGFSVGLANRPEISGFADKIARWKDSYQPPLEEAHEALGNFPYLGVDCQFVERVPGSAPWLGKIVDLSFAMLASAGLGGGNIGGIKYGVRRVVAGISKSLFVEDAQFHCNSLIGYEEQELFDLDGSKDPQASAPARDQVYAARR